MFSFHLLFQRESAAYDYFCMYHFNFYLDIFIALSLPAYFFNFQSEVNAFCNQINLAVFSALSKI